MTTGISNTIRELRAAAGMTQQDLADLIGVTRDELTRLFGARVADLVHAVSEEDKSLPWAERKSRYLARFVQSPPDAQAISIADKIDNLTSIAVCAGDHGDPWSMFKEGKDRQMERFEAFARAAATPSQALSAAPRCASESSPSAGALRRAP